MKLLKSKLKEKKGMSQMWWLISAAIIALLVVIFIVVWFKGSGGKAFGSVDTQIDQLGDYDNDNVANMFDKCVCKAGDSNAELDGCPIGTKAGADITKEKLTTENGKTVCK